EPGPAPALRAEPLPGAVKHRNHNLAILDRSVHLDPGGLPPVHHRKKVSKLPVGLLVLSDPKRGLPHTRAKLLGRLSVLDRVAHRVSEQRAWARSEGHRHPDLASSRHGAHL